MSAVDMTYGRDIGTTSCPMMKENKYDASDAASERGTLCSKRPPGSRSRQYESTAASSRNSQRTPHRHKGFESQRPRQEINTGAYETCTTPRPWITARTSEPGEGARGKGEQKQEKERWLPEKEVAPSCKKSGRRYWLAQVDRRKWCRCAR
jgi:hypothetical protein